MSKTKNRRSFENIISDINSGNYAPIYMLMGNESYYIDQISSLIEKKVLDDEEKEMNQRVVYGGDTTIEAVIMEARQFPFMAKNRVIIVKEAQNLKNIENIESYLIKPLLSTILVFCVKDAKVDGRRKYAKEIDRIGVLFESVKMYDNELPRWIEAYCRQIGLKTEANVAKLISDHIGDNLDRIVSEIDKLKILLPPDSSSISFDFAAENIGFSKEYNNFALSKALLQKNTLLVYRIVNFYGNNPKGFFILPVLANLFNQFTNILYCSLLKDKSKDNIAKHIGIHPYFAEELIEATRMYSRPKLIKIISHIRTADAQSKGFGVSHISDKEILKELCFKILS